MNQKTYLFGKHDEGDYSLFFPIGASRTGKISCPGEENLHSCQQKMICWWYYVSGMWIYSKM